MNQPDQRWLAAAFLVGIVGGSFTTQGAIVFETTSAYHHIQVIDEGDLRTLSFDGSQESRMSLVDPMLRHFEYTEYFHLPWLWNARMTNVLLIGLGGASTQRSFAHYYPHMMLETVELDPQVLQVAKDYFHFKEGPRQRVRIEDGRVFIRRSRSQYDLIILDAYSSSRYGSFIPYQLATKEFFELVRDRLSTNGVMAYNVIGSLRGYQADILGAMYRTMKTVFPQLYLFPVRQTDNVVLIGTMSSMPVTLADLQQRARYLARTKQVNMWNFKSRVAGFRSLPPPNLKHVPVLTDDYAPVDGLLNGRILDQISKP